MNTRYTIEKLKGGNYLVWSTQVQLVLESKGLWKYVSEDIKPPAGASAAETKKFSQQQRQAMAEIVLNVDSKHVASVLQRES